MPKLRYRWTPAATKPTSVFTPDERNAVYEHAARAARDAAQQIRHFAATDPGAAADAAWATADTPCTPPPAHSATPSYGEPPTPTTAPLDASTGTCPAQPPQATACAP